MKKRRNILWGLLFLALAAMIVLRALGLFAQVGIPSLIITVLLIPVMIESIKNLNFFGFLFPLAIIGIIYAEPLGIETLAPWPLLLVAVFLSIGLSFIFPHNKRNFHNHTNEERTTIGEDERQVDIYTRFSGKVTYVNSKQLESVNIEGSFSGVKVFFDNAVLAGDTLAVNVNLEFAGAELYIPKNWKIQDSITSTMGGIEEKGMHSDTADKTVLLQGKLSLAGVTVIYV